MAQGNPLTNPNVRLSGKALIQAAQALTNAQINPSIHDIQAQLNQNNRQTTGTMNLAGGYYNTLGQQAHQGVTDEQQIANDLNAKLAQIAGNTNSQLQGIGTNAQDSLQKYSPGDASLSRAAVQSLTQELARQQGLAAQQQGASAAFGATQGANYGGLAAQGAGINALRATDALKAIAQSGAVRNQPLSQKIADLNMQKGQLLATNEGKLRQQEISNDLTRQSLGNTLFGIQSANARTQATINAENQRNAATIRGENLRTQAQIIAAANRTAAQIQGHAQQGALDRQTRLQIAQINNAARAQGKGPVLTPTGQRVLTPTQQQRIFDSVDSAKGLIPQMQQPLTAAAATSLQKAGYNVQAGQKLTEGQIRHLLQAGVHPGGTFKYTPGEIDAAYALAGYGYLTPKQIVELNKMGVIVGTRYPRGGGVRGGSGGPGTNQGGVPPGNHA